MSYKILVVDDDKDNLQPTADLLKVWGYKVKTAGSGEEAIKSVRAAKEDFALILMDYHMPGMSGAQTIQEIRKLKPHQQILGFTLDDSKGVMRENFISGALDTIDKNIENDRFKEIVLAYCAKFEENFRAISSEIEDDEKAKFILETGFIGRSYPLYRTCQEIRKLGPSSATILILGESGTGKELVAQALHRASDRSQKPFVAINIGAEPPALIDSSLFGHKKGAFTGAMHDHLGKFRQADGGTLFLDEIGDLSLELQVKLLRVLQEREVSPVGGTRSISVDVRIVAATHKNLEEMVKQGTFRQDLYYRIAGVTIVNPPLRERPQDIGPLVEQFTEEVCKQNGIRRAFQKKCLDVFVAYPWHGNIRELRAVVERHLIKSDVSLLKPEDLEASLYGSKVDTKPSTIKGIESYIMDIKSKMVLDIVNQSTTKADAARKLGVSPTHLHYILGQINPTKP